MNYVSYKSENWFWLNLPYPSGKKLLRSNLKKNSHLQIYFVIFPSNFLSGLLQLFAWCIFWLDVFIYFSKGIHRWFELSVLYKEQKTEGFSHWYSLGAFKRVSCIHQLDFSYESPSKQSNKKGASNIFGTSLELII